MGYRWIAVACGLAVTSLSAPRVAHAAVFATGFSTDIAISGLDTPVAVRFAPDGSVFVAEKAGLVKRFDALPPSGTVDASAGRIVIDLRSQVGTYADRGLLGLAIDPGFPLAPYVYVLYTTDAPPAEASPLWSDSCGQPGQPDPLAWGEGCVAAGRLVRFTLAGDQVVGSTVLVDDGWYQQYTSHSVGDLAFGPDGMLYASGGEGSNWTSEGDIGSATQVSALYPNPGDPIDEGGALRAQDLLTTGDPLGYSGAVIRVDPATGPISHSPRTGPIVAFGLRNPYRIAFRPGTPELWVADVGTRRAEEVNRIVDTTDTVIENFGWPCREGERSTPYAARPLCTALASGQLPPGTPGAAMTDPHYHYLHSHAPGAEELVEPCYAGTYTALTGIAFYAGARWPAPLHGALVLADYELGCLFVVRPGTGGVPDPERAEVLARGVAAIVDVSPGPDRELYLASLSGSILRLRYTPPFDPNGAPQSGAAPSIDEAATTAGGGDGGCSAGGGAGFGLVLGIAVLLGSGRAKPSHRSVLRAESGRRFVSY